jgi:hypothetical protein
LDVEVGVGVAQRAPQAQPDRPQQLGTAGGGDVAEVDDAGGGRPKLTSSSLTVFLASASSPDTKTLCSLATREGSAMTWAFVVLRVLPTFGLGALDLPAETVGIGRVQ